jgi:hypothetical protein
MNDIEKNRIVYLALSEIKEIETSLVSMWPLDDKYSRVPFLRFRFVNTDKTDIVYTRLKDVITNYSGGLKWSLLTRDDVPNYILLPKVFEKYFYDQMLNNIGFIVSEMTESKYRLVIDTVVIDVPSLAMHIENNSKLIGS